MTQSAWLQVIGTSLQIIGVIVLGVGIGRTRRAFTPKPSMVSKAMGPVRRAWRRLRGGRHHVVELSSSVEISSSARGRLTVSPNWASLSEEQKLERLQTIVDRHEDQISNLHERVDEEAKEREDTDRAEATERKKLEAQVKGQISDLAASGLRTSTVGAFLIGSGLALVLWGLWLT